MIRVSFHTYKGCFFANVISVIGSLVDALIKVIGLACAYGMIGEAGVFPGVLIGIVMVIVASILGGFIRKAVWLLCDIMVYLKVKHKLSLSHN